jgi:hypothetical protein
MGIYVCLLYAGACLGPLLSGYVFEGMGWQAVIVSRPIAQSLEETTLIPCQ